jgi:hypothetical protein
MIYKKCACGCGKLFIPKNSVHRFYDANHKKRFAYYGKQTEKKTQENKSKILDDITPRERWEKMSLSELEKEGLRLHKTYGEIQQAYYNNTLPADFGVEILEGVNYEKDV